MSSSRSLNPLSAKFPSKPFCKHSVAMLIICGDRVGTYTREYNCSCTGAGESSSTKFQFSLPSLYLYLLSTVRSDSSSTLNAFPRFLFNNKYNLVLIFGIFSNIQVY